MLLRQTYYVCRSIIANCKLLRQAKYVKRNGRNQEMSDGIVAMAKLPGGATSLCPPGRSGHGHCVMGELIFCCSVRARKWGSPPSARNVPEGFPGYLQNSVLIACIFSAYPFSAGIRRTACRRARDLACWRSTLRRCTEYTMPTAVRYPIASRRRSSTSKCRYWTKILWV